MKKLINLWHNQDGSADIGYILFGFLISVILICVAIGVAASIHETTVLDRFADELVSAAATEGKCAGAEIERRYSELQASTKLSPTVQWSANYVDGIKQTVQYGDSITVTLQYEGKLWGWGTFSIPISKTVSSTGQSAQYWKGG